MFFYDRWFESHKAVSYIITSLFSRLTVDEKNELVNKWQPVILSFTDVRLEISDEDNIVIPSLYIIYIYINNSTNRNESQNSARYKPSMTEETAVFIFGLLCIIHIDIHIYIYIK